MLTIHDTKQPLVSKPSILSLVIKDKATLHAAYMPYVNGGGVFIPTNKPFNMGDEVFIIISLLAEPEKLKVIGNVVWLMAVAQNSRPQGIGVQFNSKSGGAEVKNKIEVILASALKSARPTHTM